MVCYIPFVPMYGGMLQRNLLYTAVTRAKRKVIMIGTKSSVERAVKTVMVKNDIHYLKNVYKEDVMDNESI